MRTRARQRGRWIGVSGGGGATGIVTGIAVTALLTDVASTTVGPIVTAGDTIPIDTEGHVIRIDFSSAPGTIDATRLTVNYVRPGYTNVVGAAAITRADVGYGLKQVRRAFPNQASNLPAGGNSVYIVVDNLFRVGDTFTLTLDPGFYTGLATQLTVPYSMVTRLDTQAYEKPILRPQFLPRRRIGADLLIPVRFGAVAEWAAFGSQVARVEARAKVGANATAWFGSGTMVRSSDTPTSGRNPSGLHADCYEFVIDATGAGLADGSGTIEYRAYGWYGDVIFDSVTDGGTFGQDYLPPSGMPFLKDAAGNHTPIYAWVNRDGTGLTTGTTGISAGTTDPGAALSYSNEATAAIGARAFNNARGHNDTSGLVILYRDSATAYWQRASLSAFHDGYLPPVMCSAQYLTSGTTSVLCRRRGVQDDSTTQATSRVHGGMIEYRGMIFDSAGQTGLGNEILDGGAGGDSTTAAGATTHFIRVDCDLYEERTASTGLTRRGGWCWDIRVDHGGVTGTEGPANQASLFTNNARYIGHLLQVGSRYRCSVLNGLSITAINMHGCRVTNIYIAGHANPTTGVIPGVEYGLIYNVRTDCTSPTTAMLFLAGNRPIMLGFGVCNYFARYVGTSTGPGISIGADGKLVEIRNLVMQHVGIDGGAADNSDRLNWLYQDNAWLQVVKRATIKYSALNSFNSKDDSFAAPEVAGAAPVNQVAFAAGVQYFKGTSVHDGNATLASRIYYQALVDSVGVAGDLSNPALWKQIGAVNGVAYGAQPLRTGTNRSQNNVRNRGNVACRTANGNTSFNVSSWYGESPWRGGAIGATWADYYKTRTGGTLGTGLLDAGDYRPKSIAGGDAVNSPLLARVPAGAAVTPRDLAGNPRLNDGNGAAGPYERSA